MPTVPRTGPYRFYFYSHDLLNEPSHVHVDRDDLSAKFWLEPVVLAANLGFAANEPRKIERMVMLHQAKLPEKWEDEYERASGA